MIRLMLATAFLFCACSHDNHDNPVPYYDIDDYVDIYLKNEQGDNLLNTPNYNSADFKIYYLLNGNPVEVYNPQMDAPRNFIIIDETDPPRMRLFLNSAVSEPFPVTYVKWNETDSDTIKASFFRGENYVRCNAVWLNGELAWSSPSTGRRTITITK